MPNSTAPERTPLTAHLVSNGWTERQAKQFIDRHWTLLGTATYAEWDELGAQYLEANA
jgi:hypothetical protein